jgi:hypothetical protein
MNKALLKGRAGRRLILRLAMAATVAWTSIYLCAAAYQTADGGALAAQCPAGSGPNIDTLDFTGMIFACPVLQ